MDLEAMVHAASLGIGAGTGLLGVAHRGSTYSDPERKVTVARGNGISARILERFPRYSAISTLVDHALAGIAVTAAFGGFTGYVATTYGNHVPLAGYVVGAAAYVAFDLLDNALSVLAGTKQLARGDAYQQAVDIGMPVAYCMGICGLLG